MKAKNAPKDKKRRHPLSRLEQLPIELLSDIFVLSENINLPKASPVLGSKLAHDTTKRRIVIHMFDDFKDTRDEEKLQSALLRQKWFTYAFLRDCQKICLRRICVEWYRRDVKDIPSSARQLISDLIYAYFDWYFSRPSRAYYRQQPPGFQEITEAEEKRWLYPDYKIARVTVNLQEEKEVYDFTGSDGLIFQMDGSPVFQFTLHENGAEITFPKAKDHVYTTRDEPKEFSRRFPEYMLGCQLPEKLLHGPWTQEKGDFLQLLMARGISRIQRIRNSNYEIAEQGLLDAINEENACALNLFLNNTFSTQAVHRVIPSTDVSKPPNISDLSIDLSPNQPENPWRYHSLKVKRRLEIEPTIKHLVTALYAHGNCVNFLVLYHIARICADLDPYDPDILTWMVEHFPDQRGRKGKALVKFPVEDGEQGEARFEWRCLGMDPFDRLLEVYPFV